MTTTPRPLVLLKEIIGDGWTERTGGATSGDPHLVIGFAEAMERKHGALGSGGSNCRAS